MTAIITGAGLGINNSSASVLGGAGVLGNAALGRANDQVYVNAASGNLVIQNPDEVLTGLGISSVISQTYNSQGQMANGGWQNSDQRSVVLTSGVINTAGSILTRTAGDGSTAVYTYNGTNYVNTSGSGGYDTISYSGSTFTWTDGRTQDTEQYDANNGGRLIYLSNGPNGDALTYSYNVSGQLAQVTDQDGEYTSFVYTGANLTSLVTTFATNGANLTAGSPTANETRVYFGYDANNRLTSVTTDLSPNDNSVVDGNVYTTTYAYVSPSSNLIASIAQSDGSLLSISYDGSNRVSSLTQTLSSGVTSTTSFGYNTSNLITTVTNAQGQAMQLAYDANGNVLSVTAPPAVAGGNAQITAYTYDANGNVLTSALYDGAANYTNGVALRETFNAYDANGNLLTSEDLLGDTTSYTYNAQNKLLTATQYTGVDPDGLSGSAQPTGALTTRYAYDANGNLAFVVSATGNVTQYLVTAAGERASEIDYASNSYNISGLAATTSLSYATLTAWVASISDKSTTQRIDYAYDFRGNLASVTSFGSVNTAGVGQISTGDYSQTLYTFDQSGNLLQKISDNGLASETFAYDGLGRQISTTNASGAVTSTVYNDTQNTTVMTLANGLVDTSLYNGLGELVSDTQSAPSIPTATTSAVYNTLGQLVMATDALGDQSYFLYDTEGRKVADITSTGSLTAYTYNAANQPIASVTYGTVLSAAQIAGLANQSITNLASILPTSSSTDRWSFSIYDPAGRVLETIDPTGAAVVYSYDGAGGVTAQISYANVFTSAQMAGFEATPPTMGSTASAIAAAQAAITSATATVASATATVTSATATYNADNAVAQSDVTAQGTVTTGTTSVSTASAAAATAAAASATATNAANAAESVAFSEFAAVSNASVAATNATTALPSAVSATAADQTTASTNYTAAASASTIATAMSSTTTLNSTASSDSSAVSSYSSTVTSSNSTASTSYASLQTAVTSVATNTTTAATALNNAINLAKSAYPSPTTAQQNVITAAQTAYATATSAANAAVASLTTGTAQAKQAAAAAASAAAAAASTAVVNIRGLFTFGSTNYNTVQGYANTASSAASSASSALSTANGISATTLSSNITLLSLYAGYTSSMLSKLLGLATALITAPTTAQQTTISTAQALVTSTSADATALTTALNQNGVTNATFTAATTAKTAAASAATSAASLTTMISSYLSGLTTSAQTAALAATVKTQTLNTASATTAVANALSAALTTTLALVTSPTSAQQTTITAAQTALTAAQSAATAATTAANAGVSSTSISAASAAASAANTAYNSVTALASLVSAFAATAPAQLAQASATATATTNTVTALNAAIATAQGLITSPTSAQQSTITAAQTAATAAQTAAAKVVTDVNGSLQQQAVSDALAAASAASSAYNAATNLYNVVISYAANSNVTAIQATATATTSAVTALNSVLSAVQALIPSPTTAQQAVITAAQTAASNATAAVTVITSATGGHFGSPTVAMANSAASAAAAALTAAQNLAALVSPIVSAANTKVTSDQSALTTAQAALTAANTALANANTALAEAQTAPAGALLPVIDPVNDRTVRHYYDADGRLIGAVNADGFVTQNFYDGAGRLAKTIAYATLPTDASPASDGFATILASISPSPNDIYSYALYNDRGLAMATIDGAGNVTRYQYDALGNVIQQTQGQQVSPGTASTTAYTLPTLPVVGSGVTLDVTTFTRNVFGQVTSAVELLANGNTQTTSYSYDVMHNLIGTTTSDTTGSGTRSSSDLYDAEGRLIASLSGVGAAALAALGASPTQSQINTIYATYGTRYSYDAAGQLIAKTMPDGVGTTGNTTHYYYTSTGQLNFAIDALGEVTEYRYNAFGNKSDVLQYGTALSSSVVSTLTGGLTTAALTSAVAAIANPSLDSHSQFSYDNRGALIMDYDPLYIASPTSAHESTFSYNAFGQLSSQTLPVNGTSSNTTTTSYNRRGLATTVTQLLNGSSVGALTQSFVYDGFGRMVKDQSNVDGRATTFSYDRAGRVVSESDALSNTTSFTYDGLNNVLSQSDALGKTTSFTHDAFNRNVTTTTPDGVSSSVQTNAYGQTIKITDGAGRVTSYAYDLDGNLTSVTNAAGTTTNVYDADDRLTDTINADGVDTHYTYDAANRVLTMTQNYVANGAVTASQNITTSYVYDAKGETIQMTQAQGTAQQRVTTYAYDLKGEEVQVVVDAGSGKLNQTTTLSYNGAGKVISQTVAAGTSAAVTTIYAYDSLGRMTSQTVDPTGINQTTQYAYDNNNNLIATTDALGHVTRSVYDQDNRLIYQVDAAGEVTQTSYDADGRVIATQSYANTIPAATLSGLPLQITAAQITSTITASANDPISRTVYDAEGRAVYQIDGDGDVTQNVYDGANNVIKTIRYANAITVPATVTLTSIAALLPTTPGAADVVTTYSYDAANRLTDVVDGNGVDTHFAMDALGQITATTVAYGTAQAATTQRVFDALGRVTAQTWGYGTPEATTVHYGYDALGRVTSTTDADGNVTTNTYDALGDLLTQTVPLGTGVTATTTRTYDLRGNITSLTDPNGNTGYFYYDSANRLVLQIDPQGYATATSYSIGSTVASVTRYALQVSGSYTTTTRPTINTSASDATTSFSYDALGRLISTSDALGNVTSYTLDSFGNRLTMTNALGGVTSYSYDKRGLVTSQTVAATLNGAGTQGAPATTTSYAYDAHGNKIAMVEAQGTAQQRTTHYTYDAMNRLLTTVGDQVVVVNPATGATSSVTPTSSIKYDLRGNVIWTQDATGAQTFYYYDHNNRKIAQVSPVGTLSTWSYDANGNALVQTIYGDPVALPTSAGGTPPSPVNGTNDRQTLYSYDRNNRLITTSVANVLTGSYANSTYTTTTGTISTTNVYDAMGNVIQQSDGNGNSITSWYNKLGQKTDQLDQSGYLTHYVLDTNGNVTSETQYATKYTGPVTAGGTPPTVSTNANDRTTTFTYDKNGHRLTETRNNVMASTVSATGVLTTASTNATIQYTYDALGDVTSQIEANGDTTTYAYDNQGRLISTLHAAITTYTGASVRQETDDSYNALGELVSTREGTSTPASTDRITSYTYGPGGRLASMTDATGTFTTSYGYDADGRVVVESYSRLLSTVTNAKELDAKFTSYDLAGRTIAQSTATSTSASVNWGAANNGVSWSVLDTKTTSYTSYGDIATKGEYVGTAPTGGATQEQYVYDTAGRLIKTNNQSGVGRFYVYDKAGNATLTLTSDGTANGADLSGMTLAGTLAAVGTITNPTATSGIDVTITTYDQRGEATATIAPNRQLTATTSVTLNTATTYDAFGDTLAHTNTGGNTTSYAYNALGDMTQKILPAVYITAQNGLISQVNGVTAMVNPIYNYAYDISGRLVGSQNANGYWTTQTLLAGTGHDNPQNAKVTAQFNTDGSKTGTGYDVFNDARTATDGLGRVTQDNYDQMDRLAQVINPSGFTVNYAYDGLGEQIAQTNSVLTNPVYSTTLSTGYHTYYSTSSSGTTSWQVPYSYYKQIGTTPAVQSTGYDALGRVTNTTSYGGTAINTSYVWSATMANSGLTATAPGGWVKTVSYAGGITTRESDDYYGYMIARTDEGGDVYSYGYNKAGELATQTSVLSAANLAGIVTNLYGTTVTAGSGQNIVYSYFNTGKIATEVSTAPTKTSRGGYYYSYTYTTGSVSNSSYGYDKDGNEISQNLSTTATTTLGTTTTTTAQLQNTAATYDALDRVTSYADSGANGLGAVNSTYEYDADSNVRQVFSSYDTISSNNGAVTLGAQTYQDFWYSYDGMDREITTQAGFNNSSGVLATTGATTSAAAWTAINAARGTGSIALGLTGTALTYDAAGERKSAINFFTATQQGVWGPIAYTAENYETYNYNADGYLISTQDAQTTDNFSVWSTTLGTLTNPTGPGAVVATDTRDAMDRVTLYQEFANGNTTATFSRADTFNNDNLVTAETDHDVQNGTDNMSVITNTYAPGNLLTSSSAASYSNNSYQLTTTTTNTYAYWGTAVQKTITTSNSNGTGTTTFAYDQSGYITSAVITGGNPQTVNYTNDAMGHILTRKVSSTSTTLTPIEVDYYLSGVQIGDNGNNGPSSTDYAVAIHQHTLNNGSGLFQNGGTTASSSANFAQTYNAIDPTSADNAGTSCGYTVKSGDTLQAIAQAIWGDSSLWYVIAQANGLSASSNLNTGEILSIPAKVMSLHNSASTSRVYNQTQAIGDVSPTTPPPPQSSDDCGGIGMILLAVIAIAVVAIVAPELIGVAAQAATATAPAVAATGLTAVLGSTGAAIVGGGLAAAAGSIVSQGIGVITGIQNSFDWGAVAEAAIGGAIGGAIGPGGLFGKAGAFGSLGAVGGGIARGVLGNVITQGVEVATGLQNSFDWASVAEAGVAAGVGSLVSENLPANIGAVGNHAISNFIGGISAAGVRSLVTGSDFGDTLYAELPSILSQTVGGAIQGAEEESAANKASTSTSGSGNGSGGSDLAIGSGVAPGTTIGGSTFTSDTNSGQTGAGATNNGNATGGAADGIVVTNGGLTAQDYAQLSASANAALGITSLNLPSLPAWSTISNSLDYLGSYYAGGGTQAYAINSSGIAVPMTHMDGSAMTVGQTSGTNAAPNPSSVPLPNVDGIPAVTASSSGSWLAGVDVMMSGQGNAGWNPVQYATQQLGWTGQSGGWSVGDIASGLWDEAASYYKIESDTLPKLASIIATNPSNADVLQQVYNQLNAKVTSIEQYGNSVVNTSIAQFAEVGLAGAAAPFVPLLGGLGASTLGVSVEGGAGIYLTTQTANAGIGAANGALNNYTNGDPVTLRTVGVDAAANFAIPVELKLLPGGSEVTSSAGKIIFSTVTSGATAGLSNTSDQYIKKGSVNWTDVRQATLTGAGLGVVAGGADTVAPEIHVNTPSSPLAPATGAGR